MPCQDKLYEKQKASWSSRGHPEDEDEVTSSSDDSADETLNCSYSNRLHVTGKKAKDDEKEKEKEKEKSKDKDNDTVKENAKAKENSIHANTIREKHYVIPDVYVWNDSVSCDHDETCDSLKTCIPICAMDFLFVAPSWYTYFHAYIFYICTLMIADTCNRVEIWDISDVLLSVSLPKIPALSSGFSNTIPGESTLPIVENPHKLTVDQILINLGLSEYVSRFQIEKIDNDSLWQLTNEDMRLLGMRIGERRKLLNYLSGVQQRLYNPSASVLSDDDEERSEIMQITASPSHDPVQDLFSDLAKFIEFRSVSSDPSCKDQCWKAARFFQERCEKFGAETRFVQGLIVTAVYLIVFLSSGIV
ncbi:Sec23-interacting protein [Reticulomyxa filosa]|uniref:Sec23-interacting protein n=1 Tax=Reticulomyxa filosa TaxID=46433 RepID=X6LVU6_RETFI|nr:Sec23-interacting protein [Reticulomyxa filosa]|eukprot:ETO05749.1 Sec23-interacting protein [Reticulomyxa filosa]